MTTIAIASQKGGTGKTATAVNLSYELSELGKKVLLVDFDSQGSATTGLGLKPRQLQRTVYDALREPERTREFILTQHNVDILPTNLHFASAELKLGGQMQVERTAWLSDALGEVRDEYDYIFIDCPPSLGFYTVNALYAADSVLIPLQVEYYAYDVLPGLFDLIRDIQKRRRRRKERLDVVGMLLTMYDRRVGLTSDIEEIAREQYGNLVFKRVIPRNIKISEASIEGMPVREFNSKSSGAQAYQEFAQEFLKRITE